MRDRLRRWHWPLSLGIGFACLIVALATGPVVMLVLTTLGILLMFDGVTSLWAGANRTGGLPDHRQ
jgi:hypothetical protein